MHSRRTLRASTIVATLALAACAGNGQGLDSNGRPISEGSGGSGPLTADFQSIQDHVFTPICTVCHAGANAPQGLRLDSTNSYDLLVGVRSNEVSSLLRVKPGDPDHSYIIQKLEGHAAVGARMPFGGPYLDQATIDVIRQWITDGALRSPTAGVTKAAFTVSATAPAPGDVLAESPASLVIGFTRELDRTRIDPSVAQLERVLADATSGTPQRVTADVAVNDANPLALIVTPQAPLEPGRYVLRIASSGIADLSGAPLAAAAGEAINESTVIVFSVGAGP
jgi:methionine-rich copper-binding protein CopC